jgi:predicted nucleic acid-binding Zn ribbon protein
VRRFGGGGRDVLAAVFSRWPDVVGDAVAAHTRPLSLSRGTLVVAVDQPAWATQLRFLSGDLLARLADVAGPGAVRAIEVRVRA